MLTTPDGSCLLALCLPADPAQPVLRSYHIGSLGANNGASLILPDGDWTNSALSSLVNRSNVHLLRLDPHSKSVRSCRLFIVSKASEYSFKTKTPFYSRAGPSSLRRNGLIKCHSDVWTKYPVLPTISRKSPASSPHPRSILFVSYGLLGRFEPQFRLMVQLFERSTQKPTGGVLGKMNVLALHHNDFSGTHQTQHVTVYPVGRWLVELICLIPLHIAIATTNQFVPLKDGVVSPEFEHTLLGADVLRIAERFSFQHA